MDKNEYNAKLQEIDGCVDAGNTAQAAAIADTIDWKRVRNVRTLCMISEIYEAEGRYQDSKDLLLRAYRRSPLGRAILYRLVEVTIHLRQFDEAIEYYSEYVQAAPHDNNRYILKYKIYRGRGSSIEEQIDILKEYLDQEYSEKYAYELARLYQQADRIQDCLTTCDDLVLWFHSGKYVIKALELKAKYAQLTPKQQEIYDHRFDELPEEDGIGTEKKIVEDGNASAAETIMQDTEREIAQEIAQAAQEAMGTEQEAPSEADAAAQTRPFVGGNPALADTVEPDSGEADVDAIVDIVKEEKEKQTSEEGTFAEDALQRLAGYRQGTVPEQKSSDRNLLEQTSQETQVSLGELDLNQIGSQVREALAEEDTEEVSAGETFEMETSVNEGTVAEADAAEGSDAENISAETTPVETTPAEEPPVVDTRTPEQIQEDVARGVRELTAGIGIRDTIDENELLIDQVIEESKKDQEAAQHAREQADQGVTFKSRLKMPEFDKKKNASQLTIDDILLSMGERGAAVREAAAKAQSAKKPQATGVLSAVDEALLNMGIDLETGEPKETKEKTGVDHNAMTDDDAVPETASAEEELFPEGTRQALEEAFPLPPSSEEEKSATAKLPDLTGQEKVTLGMEDLEEILTAKTRKIPTDTIAALHHSTPILSQPEEPEALQGDYGKPVEITLETPEPPAFLKKEDAGQQDDAQISDDYTESPVQADTAAEFVQEPDLSKLQALLEQNAEAQARQAPVQETQDPGTLSDAAQDEKFAENAAAFLQEEVLEEPVPDLAEPAHVQDFSEQAGAPEEDAAEENAAENQEVSAEEIEDAVSSVDQDTPVEAEQGAAWGTGVGQVAKEDQGSAAEEKRDAAFEEDQEPVPDESVSEESQEMLPEEEPVDSAGQDLKCAGHVVPDYQRELFEGFLGVQNLEDQIAYAIEQALAKDADRTSRTGNVLIFGGHGCGKTTIAIGIAKAIAQERGDEFVKMARIYATDLNRKDIAATIAKIAGGILIVEEAGDLEDAIVDQLTTAMEFRTDGTILILEDEQKYLHDLLLRHPRFTMKFTSQIYIPVFTTQELVRFGEIYAEDQDYVMSPEAEQVLHGRLTTLSEQGEPLSISNVLEQMDRAILSANKFGRKLFAGKKRYDEAGRVILLEKDMR